MQDGFEYLIVLPILGWAIDRQILRQANASHALKILIRYSI
jgi:hypothetical protein